MEEVSEHPGSAEAQPEPVEYQEPPEEQIELVTPEHELELASNECMKTEFGSSDEIGLPKAETEEPSLPMEVPNDKLIQPNPSDLEQSNEWIVRIVGDTKQLGIAKEMLKDAMILMNQISRDADIDPQSTTVPFELVGTLEDKNKSEKLKKGGFAEANAGGSPSPVAFGLNAGQAARGFEQIEKQVPNGIDSYLSFKNRHIRSMQIRPRELFELVQPNPSDGEQSKEWIVRIVGDTKQLEIAKERLKDAMNQTARHSFLSSGYSQQQGHRPHGLVAPQCGCRGGSHHSQKFGYGYPGWDQRPPTSMHRPLSQGNYNYGQHPPSQTQPPQHDGPQPTPYAQGGSTTHSGYGSPQDQYGKPPPVYNMQQPQGPPAHAQPCGQQPRPNQPVEAPKQGPAQTYGQSSRSSQQQNPYTPSGPMPQTYTNPPYGSAPASAGYGQTYPNNPPDAASSGYGQPVAGCAQQPPQAGSTRGYGLYPAPQPAACAEQQPAANIAAAYGYQAPVDPAAYGAPPQLVPPAAAYLVAAAYEDQRTQAHQPVFYQSGGSGGVAAAAPVVGVQQQQR